MKPDLRLVLASAAAVLAVIAATFIDAPLAVDAARAPHLIVLGGRFVTSFGTSDYMFVFSGAIAIAAVAALAAGRERWQGDSLRLVAERAFYFFAAIAMSGLLAQVVKHLVGRARPVLFGIDGPFHLAGPSIHNIFASFPSGHTTSAFAAAVALGFMKPRWRVWLLAAAASIGLSRIVVGAHFASDVVAGAALGSFVSLRLARSFALRGMAFAIRSGRAVVLPLRAAPTGSKVSP